MTPRLLAALVALAALRSAWGATREDVRLCLEANDVACAESALHDLGEPTSRDPETLALIGETHFSAGRYEEALAAMQKAVSAGYDDRWDDLGLYQRTADVMKDWSEVRRERAAVRFRPGVDEILVDEAMATVEGAEAHISGLLGGPPPGPVLLEIYPDGRSFIACSSLTEKDVQTTGVVALSRWSRLLLTSPRALGRGYEWKDTVAHEYTHLVVAHFTDNQAPVWLQEAIARYLDNRWRDGQDHFRLGVRDQALLATALREQDGQVDPKKPATAHKGFVPFERMHPSLAKLPSAEMAALAYAQLASLMDFAFEQGGEDVLLEALPLVRQGEDPRVALARAAGATSFEKLERDWMQWLRTQRLEQRNGAEMPTALDGADEAETDPVMAQREDLRRWLRLGDLLLERGHPKAALVEYARAQSPGEPASPLLANRVAKAYLSLKDTHSARRALEESLASYPEFALTHKTLGEILAAQGDVQGALQSYRRAADLNPFDPAVQDALVQLYARSGQTATSAVHNGYLRMLRRGGHELGEPLLNPEAN
jgi:tetratricopeptide (TPR) repeat protein